MNIKAKKLNEKETRQAKHFLYDIYSGQMNWIPEENNPSEWRVREDESGKYFEDMFNCSAQWFAVYDNNVIAATGRIFTPVENKLEVEMYTDLPEKYKQPGFTRVEMNRLAIDEKYNGTMVLGLLFRQILIYARDKGIDYIVTGAPESTFPIVRDMHFKAVQTFKYAEGDTDQVYCSVLETADKMFLNSIISGLPSKEYILKFF